MFSLGIISQIPCTCFTNDGCYMLHVCLYALVTQKWLQNVSQNLFQWILVPLGGKGGGSCVQGIVQDWIAREKREISGNLCPTYFCCNKDLIRAMLQLPICYGTSSSTFCQQPDLKEAFENINKHQLQTALKLEV